LSRTPSGSARISVRHSKVVPQFADTVFRNFTFYHEQIELTAGGQAQAGPLAKKTASLIENQTLAAQIL
jgi:hypothetical protein